MVEPAADRCDVDEAQKVFRGLVVTSGDAAGILQFVEASLRELTELVERAVSCHAQIAGFSYLDHGNSGSRKRRYALSWFCKPCQSYSLDPPARLRVRAGCRPCPDRSPDFRGLLECDVRSHGKACAVDAEVDLGNKATTRAAETLSRSPPFAPTA